MTAETVKALKDLVPVMEALGGVGIPILASIVGLGIVIYLAYKLPTILKDINTAIVNSTTVAQESVETLKTINQNEQEFRVLLTAHHENGIQVKSDQADSIKILDSVHANMATSQHVARLQTNS